MTRSVNRSKNGIIALALILAFVIGFFYFDLFLFFKPAPVEMDTNVLFQMQKAKIPGASLGVIKNDKLVLAKGYGLANTADGRAVEAKTIFTIASVSKPVTAAALMRLYDQGRIKLDDDVNVWLPFSVRNPRYPHTPITFRMLLAHTSSIQDAPIYESMYTLHDAARPQDSPVKLSAFLADYLPTSGLYYNGDKNYTGDKPGTKTVYSNVAYGLIGYLVERISKESFDRFCQREVFDMLEMNSTKWFYRDTDLSRMAIPTTYQWLLRRYVPVGFYGFPTYPDGALKTTVPDYARFVAAFMNDGKTQEGKTFLKPATVTEMLKVQYPGTGDRYGLGWEITENGYKHDGGDPGIFTYVQFDAQKRSAFLIFTNGDSGNLLMRILLAPGFVESIAHTLQPLVK